MLRHPQGPGCADRLAHADGRSGSASGPENRTPKIRDFIGLAGLDDLVFGGWDIFADDTYAAARTAGVLEPSLLDQVRPEMEAIKPMPAVFDQRYVKRLSGPNVKKGRNKQDLAEQLIADIRAFKATHGCDRLVMVWTAAPKSS